MIEPEYTDVYQDGDVKGEVRTYSTGAVVYWLTVGMGALRIRDINQLKTIQEVVDTMLEDNDE